MLRMEALRGGVCLLGFATLSQAAPVSNTLSGKMSNTVSHIIMRVCSYFTHVVIYKCIVGLLWYSIMVLYMYMTRQGTVLAWDMSKYHGSLLLCCQ